jgi:hypothetical protein
MASHSQHHQTEGRFDFEWNGNDGNSYEAFQKLRERIILSPGHINPGTFAIYLTKTSILDENFARVVLELFQYCIFQQRMWDTLELRTENGIGPLPYSTLRKILSVANESSLFKRFEIQHDEHNAESLDTSSEETCFLSDVRLNQRLEALDISILTQISLGDAMVLCQLLQTTQSLKELCLQLSSQLDTACFCKSLTTNSTLKMFTLIIGEYKISDLTFSNIIGALAVNASLQHLTIESADRFGENSCLALKSLLATSKSLSTLKIFGYSQTASQKTAHIDEILQGIQWSKSLKYLEVSAGICGNFEVSSIFRVLYNSPALERIDLWESNFTKDNLRDIMNMDRLPKSIEIHLHNVFPFAIAPLSTPIQNVLEAHPELRLVIPSYSMAHQSDKLHHSFYMNWYGRYLLYRPDLPLSVWPLVMERANRKSSVMYEFLKGPAFAGR